MKKVFLDTNILIDYVTGREHSDDASQLLQRGRDGELSLAVSFLTFANIAYILGKKINIYELFTDLCRYITILPMDSSQFLSALGQRVHDFEDMLQYQCAKHAGYDVIVTNNKRDFTEFCDMPLMTAEEFLSSLHE